MPDSSSTSAARIAERIAATLGPKSVLDTSPDDGLVTELRRCGIEATAIGPEPPTAPIAGRYDLVTCLDVLQRLRPEDAPAAVAALAGVTDHVLFSCDPDRFDDAGLVGVRPPEQWGALFAEHGFFRADHDATFAGPWAVVYERREPHLLHLVRDYERIQSRLQHEVVERRRAGIALGEELKRRRTQADAAGEIPQLREEILRLRDVALGNEAIAARAQARATELQAWVERYDGIVARCDALEERCRELTEQRDTIAGSTSWRLSQAVLAPLRWVRRRRPA